MVDFYLKTAARFLLYNKSREEEMYHRCIATLICHNNEEDPYVAVLCTGTKMNTGECYSTKNDRKKDLPCDGHAESLCYEVAPIYFQQEMKNCIDRQKSIFEYKDGIFSLKPQTEFHLLVTEHPCGWIQKNTDPCMEWKPCHEKAPHIPTCSSKILINSKMGIQGYVSHLLKNPIFIQSVIILKESQGKKVSTIKCNSGNFDFELPKICTLEYNSNDFNPLCETFRAMNLTENIVGNKKKIKLKCYVVINQSNTHKPEIIWLYNPIDGNEVYDQLNTVKSMFSISKRYIDATLSRQVDKKLQEQKVKEMNQAYEELKSRIDLPETLKKHIADIEESLKRKKERISDRTKELCFEVDKENQKLFDEKFWKDRISEETSIVTSCREMDNTQNMLRDFKEIQNNNIILDCSWKRYFDKNLP